MLTEKYLSVLPSVFLYPAVGFRTGFESKPESLIMQETPYILELFRVEADGNYISKAQWELFPDYAEDVTCLQDYDHPRIGMTR